MFEGIASPAQSMLWLAIIEAAGFTAFTAMAILPLVRALRGQTENLNEQLVIVRRQMDILIRLLERQEEEEAQKAEENENHAS